jgi:hypothetical protein
MLTQSLTIERMGENRASQTNPSKNYPTVLPFDSITITVLFLGKVTTCLPAFIYHLIEKWAGQHLAFSTSESDVSSKMQQHPQTWHKVSPFWFTKLATRQRQLRYWPPFSLPHNARNPYSPDVWSVIAKNKHCKDMPCRLVAFKLLDINYITMDIGNTPFASTAIPPIENQDPIVKQW